MQVGDAFAVQGAQFVAALDKQDKVSRILAYTIMRHKYYSRISLLFRSSNTCLLLISRCKQNLQEIKAQNNRIERLLAIQDAERQGAQIAGAAERERWEWREDSGFQQQLQEFRRGDTQPTQHQRLPPSSRSAEPSQQHPRQPQPEYGASDDETAVRQFITRLKDCKKNVKEFWAAWDKGTVGSGVGAVSLPGGRSWSDMEDAFTRKISSPADDIYRAWRASRQSTKSSEGALGQGRAYMFKLRPFLAELKVEMVGAGECEEKLEALQLRVDSAGSINKYSEMLAKEKKLENEAASAPL